MSFNFYPKADYLKVRAEVRSNELAGKPLPRCSQKDINNANARREIDRRRMEKEARE